MDDAEAHWIVRKFRWPWLAVPLLVGLRAPVGVAQTVEGLVRDAGSNAVIPDADVALVKQVDRAVLHATTDSVGSFFFTLRMGGVYQVRASRIGYETFESEPFLVTAGATVTADVFLKVRPVELEPLDVVTEGQVPSLRRVGFYRRMARGIGYFLLREDIVAAHADRVTDLFRRMSGVQVVADGAQGTEDVIMRGGRSMIFRIQPGEPREDVCYPSISIDGHVVRVGGTQPANWNNPERQVGTWGTLVHPNDVEAVEVYPGGGGLPAQVAGYVSPCGAILIWTGG